MRWPDWGTFDRETQQFGLAVTGGRVTMVGCFAAGIIAAGGTLGILLPPSITMILNWKGKP